MDWSLCCQKAVEQLKRIGISHAKNSWRVTEWYRDFWVNWKFWVHANKKENLPPFLQQNPDLCTLILEYTREHQHELSINFLSEYIHDTILPLLIMEKTPSSSSSSYGAPVLPGSPIPVLLKDEYEAELKQELKKIGLTCVSPSTVYHWMYHLSFKYLPQQKSLLCWWTWTTCNCGMPMDFVQQYLAYEQWMHWWIQITAAEAMELE